MCWPGGDAPRDITLIATGTEVGLAMAARSELSAMGISAAVVSMPCWEAFEAQPPVCQAQVLGDAPRIAVEAALRFGWDRWLRPTDAFIGMPGFGASATAPVLYDHFGITTGRIVSTARGML